ncbi:MAG: ribonuclease PH [Rickettsiales bacterium]|jgi:ribonuclease PH|nr:ribonuclease PH [Rickettsiales bacterium]
MMRPSLRKNDQIRPVSMEINVNKWAEGSCLIKIGGTHVLCTASVDMNQPLWKRQQNKPGGWVTAEYSMLPRAVGIRKGREALAKDHRSSEISRLVGRALRSVVNMDKLGKHTIIIDCDVIQADGGTRCASITGGFVALSLAVKWLIDRGRIYDNPISDYVAAIGAGVLNSENMLDFDFEEDCAAELDANFVISGGGKFIEIQATGEEHPFAQEQIINLMDMAKVGCEKLIDLQRQILE